LRRSLSSRAISEAIGTAFLLAAIVGSGIMGERLCAGNVALLLLTNTLATSAVLLALIISFENISGAHFNPAITLATALQKRIEWREGMVYCLAQTAGAFLGAAMAHLMFGLSPFSPANNIHSGTGQLISEVIASFGLVLIVLTCRHSRPSAAPFAVPAYIAAAYWFTASTSFANPAVTLARATSNTFVGIRPLDTPGFIGAQLLGTLAATILVRWLFTARITENHEC